MKRIINPWMGKEGYNCFGCAPGNEWGLKMEFFEDGDEIVSKWVPDGRFQGWLNTLHGGIQSVLLDEIGGWTVIRKMQTTGVTSKMETRFMKPVSTEEPFLTLRSKVTGVRHNLVSITASLHNSKGELCSQSVMTYFTFPKEKAEKEMCFTGCLTEGEEGREG